MDIDLDDTHFLRCEDLNVVLMKRVVITGERARGKAPNPENIGQEREKILGYYGQVSHALIVYCDRIGRAAETIHGVRDAWFAAVERIEAACAGIKSNGQVAPPEVPAAKKRPPPMMTMQDKTKVFKEAVSILAADKAKPRVLAGAPESLPPLSLPPPPFP